MYSLLAWSGGGRRERKEEEKEDEDDALYRSPRRWCLYDSSAGFPGSVFLMYIYVCVCVHNKENRDKKKGGQRKYSV